MKTKRIWALAGAFAVVMLVVGALILPASGATGLRQEGCFPLHEVQPDETLDSVAELYGISVPDLLAANELADDTELYAGQQLCIPTSATEVIEAPAVEATGVATETLTVEVTAPAVEATGTATETLTVEVTAPAVEATGTTTETLTVEAAVPAVEALVARPPSGVPTRICVEGQVVDKGHKGIAGMTVMAQRGNGPTARAETDKDGRFAFTDLMPGAWVFRAQVPDAWVPVTSRKISVDLTYDHGGCYDIRFKLDPRGCILAKKTDETGKPLPGWRIMASGPIYGEAVTGPDGVARIDGLDPGTYLVGDKASDTIPMPWIWTSVTPSRLSMQVEVAWSEKDCVEVEFKNKAQETSCITGYKVDDNHKPLAGWKIYARPEDDEEPVFSATTAADGSFTFLGLPLATWTVWEEVLPYWTPITPSKFAVTLKKPSAPPDCVVVRFKNQAPDLCAVGHKVDENGDGLAGWAVSAFSAANPDKVISTVTDAEGYYRFNGLTAGEWVFRVKDQTGWKPIDSDTAKVEIAAGSSCTKVPTLRSRPPRGCIEGFKRDNQGYGIAGWKVTLNPKSGDSSQHAWTDGTGYYVFDELAMGTYEVYEERQPGWAAVTPMKYKVELKPSDKDDCARIQPFVNKQVPRDICIDGYKLDEADNVGLPDWPVEAKNLATEEVLKTTTDGVGYFRFSNLQPGQYKVTVGEKEGWVRVGPTSRTVAVAWPPKNECVNLEFYNRQEKTPHQDSAGDDGPGDGGCRAVHTVCSGDTLNKIAAWNDTSLRAILRVNEIPNADLIYPGQELCIP